MSRPVFHIFLCTLALLQSTILEAASYRYARQTRSSRLQNKKRAPLKKTVKKNSRAIPIYSSLLRSVTKKRVIVAQNTKKSSSKSTSLKLAALNAYSKAKKKQPALPKGPLSSTELAQNIHKAAQDAHKKASVGIKIVSLKTQKVLYQKNADQLFTPASNTKIFTACAAYHILGSDHRFETELLTNKQLTSGRIENLYIRGTGDPTLTAQDLEELVHSLKNRSVREIQNLVVDSSLFDTQTTAPGWTPGDGPIFDKSPVGGLMVNHSCISVGIQPARIVGHKPIVHLDPPASVTVENKARTVASGSKTKLHVSRTKNNTIVVQGTIAKGAKQKYYRFSVDQPHIFAGHALMNLLKKHKIQCRGKLMIGKTPPNAKVLARHQSETCDSIVHYMMKQSDNLYADALAKKMGAVRYGTPGSFASGTRAIHEFLKKETLIDLTGFVLNDGSGLSHANKISPNHLSSFLYWIYTKAPFKEKFMSSLPLSGVDGTLRRRMQKRSAHAKVKAKTGNLSGVTSLSGFITPQKGEHFSFVIVVNRKNKSAVEFKRKLEDHICTLLAAHAFSTS